MTNLAHWNFALEFSGAEAAALMAGFDPSEFGRVLAGNTLDFETAKRRIRTTPPYKRLQQSYTMFKEWFPAKVLPSYPWHENRPEEFLLSQEMQAKLGPRRRGMSDFVRWLQNDEESNFENQRFSRAEIVRWLAATGMQSKYQFDLALCVANTDMNSHSVVDVGARSKPDAEVSGAAYPVVDTVNVEPAESVDIDPSERPLELDAANLAFSAVKNGDRAGRGSVRKRLVDYLHEHHPRLNRTQVDRIATVANYDKTTGRKSFDKQ